MKVSEVGKCLVVWAHVDEEREHVIKGKPASFSPVSFLSLNPAV